MTQTNLKIDHFEKVIIQRISKALELVQTATGMLAVFPQSEPELTKSNIIEKLLRFEIRFIKISSGIGGSKYFAQISKLVTWKKSYWRKWRVENREVLQLQSSNLLRLVKMVRTEFDSIGWDRGKRKTCDFCHGSGENGYNILQQKINPCIKCGGNGIFVFPAPGEPLCIGIFKDEACPLEAAAEKDSIFCAHCYNIGADNAQEMEFDEHINGV